MCDTKTPDMYTVAIIQQDGKIIDGQRSRAYLQWTAWDESREWNSIYIGDFNVSSVSSTSKHGQYNKVASDMFRKCSGLYDTVVLFRHKNSQIFNYNVEMLMSDMMSNVADINTDIVYRDTPTGYHMSNTSEEDDEMFDDEM